MTLYSADLSHQQQLSLKHLMHQTARLKAYVFMRVVFEFNRLFDRISIQQVSNQVSIEFIFRCLIRRLKLLRTISLYEDKSKSAAFSQHI